MSDAKNVVGHANALRAKYDKLVNSNYNKKLDMDYLLDLARQTGYEECLDNEAQNCEEI